MNRSPRRTRKGATAAYLFAFPVLIFAALVAAIAAIGAATAGGKAVCAVIAAAALTAAAALAWHYLRGSR